MSAAQVEPVWAPLFFLHVRSTRLPDGSVREGWLDTVHEEYVERIINPYGRWIEPYWITEDK